jgi:N utilization substance protein B
VIERCVLRLAFYELEKTDTPVPVVINEAVDLAKYFSNPESGAFVNGILDRHARKRKA